MPGSLKWDDVLAASEKFRAKADGFNKKAALEVDECCQAYYESLVSSKAFKKAHEDIEEDSKEMVLDYPKMFHNSTYQNLVSAWAYSRPDKIAIVKMAPGSGKTFCIIKLIVRHKSAGDKR